MTYGEALGAEGRGLFKMAALTFFVELQKLNGFEFEGANIDMDQAIERAEVFVNGIAEALDAEVREDEPQEEGGKA